MSGLDALRLGRLVHGFGQDLRASRQAALNALMIERRGAGRSALVFGIELAKLLEDIELVFGKVEFDFHGTTSCVAHGAL